MFPTAQPLQSSLLFNELSGGNTFLPDTKRRAEDHQMNSPSYWDGKKEAPVPKHGSGVHSENLGERQNPWCR